MDFAVDELKDFDIGQRVLVLLPVMIVNPQEAAGGQHDSEVLVEYDAGRLYLFGTTAVVGRPEEAAPMRSVRIAISGRVLEEATEVELLNLLEPALMDSVFLDAPQVAVLFKDQAE